MLEVLKFIFQDFWHWLGAVILLEVLVEGSVAIVKAVIERWKNK